MQVQGAGNERLLIAELALDAACDLDEACNVNLEADGD